MSGGGERGYARGAAPRRAARRASTSTAGPASRSRRAGSARPGKRVRAIRDRLRELYGSRRNDPHGDPVHELVLTILSQNTSDGNRDVAYRRLRDRFDDWESIRDAPAEDVIEAIRPGGLANTRARGSKRSSASSAPSRISTGSAKRLAARRSAI